MLNQDTFSISNLTLVTFIPCMLMSVVLCVRQEGTFQAYRNSKKAALLATFAWLCVMVIPVFYAVAVPGYVNHAREQNNAVDASMTNCTVFRVEHIFDIPSNTIQYRCYFMHIPANITNSYYGVCNDHNICYPSIGDIVRCYLQYNTYVVSPHYADVEWFEKHRAFGYMQLVVFGICVLINLKYTIEYLLDGICDFGGLRFRGNIVSPEIDRELNIVRLVPSVSPSDPQEGILQPDTDERKIKSLSCAICMTNQSRYMFESCRHLCICETCSSNYSTNSCVICRSVSKRVLVYF